MQTLKFQEVSSVNYYNRRDAQFIDSLQQQYQQQDLQMLLKAKYDVPM